MKVKKFIATFLAVAMMAVLVPLVANAQTRSSKRYNRSNQTRRYVKKDQNVYDRHRNLINIGIGSGAGAIIGALVGGKKGALIGAAAGAGGGALYTYGINPKNKKKRRYYRRP